MLYIVIPTYNEGPSIGPFFENLDLALKGQGLEARLVVIDDGSTDQTAGELDRMSEAGSILVLRHPENRGVGPALESGFRCVLAKGSQGDYVAVLEADGTNDARLLGEMVQRLNNGYDVVIGSRLAPGGSMKGFPFHRQAFSKMGNRALGMMIRYPGVNDYTIFFRCYRLSALRKVAEVSNGRLFEESGFAANCEILFKIACFGARITEVPLVYRYDLKRSTSKMRLGKTISRYLGLIQRFRAPIRCALAEERLRN